MPWPRPEAASGPPTWPEPGPGRHWSSRVPPRPSARPADTLARCGRHPRSGSTSCPPCSTGHHWARCSRGRCDPIWCQSLASSIRGEGLDLPAHQSPARITLHRLRLTVSREVIRSPAFIAGRRPRPGREPATIRAVAPSGRPGAAPHAPRQGPIRTVSLPPPSARPLPHHISICRSSSTNDAPRLVSTRTARCPGWPQW